VEQCSRFFESLPAGKWTVIFLSVINKTVNNDFDAFQRNVHLVRNFTRAQSSADIGGIVYFSSVDVYGNNPEKPITEQSRIQPDTWYGLAKYNCEWILSSSGEVRCPVTILRVPGVYGPALKDRSVIGRLVRSIRETRTASISGSGRAQRDYVYIGDVLKLISRLAPLGYHGVLNVVTGQSHSILDIARVAGEVLKQKFEIKHEPADTAREFDLEFDNRLLLSIVPGFEFTDLRAGIASYV
jgi:UDP-glucose 4-epimerase